MDIIKDRSTEIDYEHEYRQPTLPPLTPETEARWNEMLSARQFPGAKVNGGNDTFFQNRYQHQELDKMAPVLREKLLEDAKAQGVSIQGKIYVDGLARYANDAMGWVSSTEELKAKCAAQGKSCQGAVNYVSNPRDPRMED